MCIYRSPSQNRGEFDNFCTNFDILLNYINDESSLCSTVTGDFNARCSRWWKNDTTKLQGQELDYLTLSAGYNQITDKPTHVINNSMSCNDLIFRTNRSLISDHGVDISIFDKCHRNIIYGKINIRYLSLQCMSERSGIIKQILKILRKEYLTLTGINSFGTLKTLLNVFRNYIPKKKLNLTIGDLNR